MAREIVADLFVCLFVCLFIFVLHHITTLLITVLQTVTLCLSSLYSLGRGYLFMFSGVYLCVWATDCVCVCVCARARACLCACELVASGFVHVSVGISCIYIGELSAGMCRSRFAGKCNNNRLIQTDPVQWWSAAHIQTRVCYLLLRWWQVLTDNVDDDVIVNDDDDDDDGCMSRSFIRSFIELYV